MNYCKSIHILFSFKTSIIKIEYVNFLIIKFFLKNEQTSSRYRNHCRYLKRYTVWETCVQLKKNQREHLQNAERQFSILILNMNNSKMFAGIIKYILMSARPSVSSFIFTKPLVGLIFLSIKTSIFARYLAYLYIKPNLQMFYSYHK